MIPFCCRSSPLRASGRAAHSGASVHSLELHFVADDGRSFLQILFVGDDAAAPLFKKFGAEFTSQDRCFATIGGVK
ncbi:MAG: hypothetical protein B7Y49_05635 [Sphingomonas sp. 28-62-11]|nr:MAG: hypothetical protein B7Y49_05635 [Sphingomonas sp. 28-62-11]